MADIKDTVLRKREAITSGGGERAGGGCGNEQGGGRWGWFGPSGEFHRSGPAPPPPPDGYPPEVRVFGHGPGVGSGRGF
ncbi:hypothetical protein GWI33_013919 [Rhynchophorus ferrugineus]|uniref:Uncharacterized protein n=1 Tax=Rhynchophorus ferrugineus TaxID=354439 RepID=A0A834I644_RHYFE|nr:hypothetical protein GWI33_013919 [Rhynchophorus ferrugineus]